MNEQIEREKGIQGTLWNSMHDGYFSDPAVAAPLIRKIREIAGRAKPQTIIDLGGGTGFMLSRLLKAGLAPDVSLINLDESVLQLEAAKSEGLTCLQGAVDAFDRCDVGGDEGRCLFMMRSVLHYFGKDGLRPVLRHVRAQAKPGEYFIHQTASFERVRDANCLNNLYAMMQTQKWYPTTTALRRDLKAEGWTVVEMCPAAPLRLKDADLQQRYGLTQKDLQLIRSRLSRNRRVLPDVFRKTSDGFCAFLHYWIYVCTPSFPETVHRNAKREVSRS
jgi:SAM-dependent methyltransferase